MLDVVIAILRSLGLNLEESSIYLTPDMVFVYEGNITKIELSDSSISIYGYDYSYENIVEYYEAELADITQQELYNIINEFINR